MKFQFVYQKLLDHRSALEDVARRNWLEAKNKVDQAKAEIDAMYSQIDSARQSAGELEAVGGAHAPRLVQIDEFINGQKIRIERQRLVVRELLAEAERLQEILVEAAKERKILEKLRERRLDEHKLKQRKLELKRTDELVVTRFRRSED